MLNVVVRHKALKALSNSLALIVLVSAVGLIAGCGDSASSTGNAVIPGSSPDAPKLIPGEPPGGMKGGTPTPTGK